MREKAIDELARILHQKMEHLDPSNLPYEWDDVPARNKEFYHTLIEELLVHPELLDGAR